MTVFQINRKYLKQVDALMLILLLAVSVISVLTIYSTTRPIMSSSLQPNYYLKQSVWVLIGFIVLFIVLVKDYIWLKDAGYVIYGIGIFLLVLVLLMGKSGLGAQRWLDLKIFSFQPSEIFRLILVIGLSKYLSSVKSPLDRRSFFLSLVVFGIIPFILIIKQPHLGTGIILFATFLFLVISKKIEKKLLLILIAIALVVVPLGGKTVWKHLKDYQKNRILAFVNPDIDPRGIGYQIEQSKITIGSGMTFGRGYLKGTQGPLKFLPEKHTDFVFSVFAEEWGFVGSIFLFSLYLIFFIRGFDTALKAKDEFGKYMASGLTFMLFLYFLINIGMTLGMMPVVGVPIPFMSYGGTSLISNFIIVGIIINIRMRRLVMV
ncbi:rod shape-determining protein RodA [Candidatus Magnetomonas plexicatena]|uniref:rod shape-determining protein RodA n=1 Tax=Candidatus Magnetomonas plexicatena TaxID=2552947 RepID=UPI001C760F38|nr:rod shape-determining protein RodA [Nitrospirales bacterium LBB_01]